MQFIQNIKPFTTTVEIHSTLHQLPDNVFVPSYIFSSHGKAVGGSLITGRQPSPSLHPSCPRCDPSRCRCLRLQHPPATPALPSPPATHRKIKVEYCMAKSPQMNIALCQLRLHSPNSVCTSQNNKFYSKQVPYELKLLVLRLNDIHITSL